jgi:hypothetical protein
MENLLFTLNAILPILLPIMLGYLLKRLHFFKEGFLEQANKLVFKIFIPILLFSNLYLADISSIKWNFVLFAGGSIIILFFVGLLISLFFPDKKQKGVIAQAAFRSNYAIIGIPLATMLGGAEAGTMASVVAAISVPLFNILGVISLSIFTAEDGKKVSLKSIIIGVFAGLVCCLINTLIGMDNVKNFISGENASLRGMKFIYDTINSLSKVATPLALIVLGGRFEFRAVKKLIKQLSVAVTFRLFITPAIFLVIAYFLHFNSATEFAILIALFATPTAVSSAPMAGQMGQDEELAGQIVVWTSALSSFSLFIIIIICKSIGIF